MNKRMLVGLIAGVLILAACGGDADEPADAAAAPEETVETTSSPEAEEEDDSTSSMDGCQSAPKSKTEIKITQVDVQFKPGKIEVPAGEMVTLVISNKGQMEHSWTSDAIGCDSGLIPALSRGSVTFEMPDKAVPFYCTPHYDIMKGKLVPV